MLVVSSTFQPTNFNSILYFEILLDTICQTFFKFNPITLSMISILIASLITVVHYLVSILRNELTWNAEVETSDPKKYSVVNWLFHAMNVANASPHAEDMDSKLWDYCARLLLTKNEFQAWKNPFQSCRQYTEGIACTTTKNRNS